MKLYTYAGAIWMIKSGVDVANVEKKLNIHINYIEILNG